MTGTTTMTMTLSPRMGADLARRPTSVQGGSVVQCVEQSATLWITLSR